MRESIGKDRNLVALATAGVIFVLFLVAYYLPRQSEFRQSRETLKTLGTTRQEVALMLPQLVQTAFTTPEPADNVRSWISAEALRGLEKQMVSNDGILAGKGAKVKLRRLSPQQASSFLSQLTRVRLEVEHMILQDSDHDGRWDMDIDLKVPSLK